MTLAANEPTDQRMVSELPSYIRANRIAINAMTATSGGISNNSLEVAAGATILTVGIELSEGGLETIICTGAGAATLAAIVGGTEGQIKIFVFQDTNVELTDSNSKLLGTFYLNQLPAGQEFEPQVDDVLALINIGGDGASESGYWKELYRTLSVK
jgi:hypothetical protein